MILVIAPRHDRYVDFCRENNLRPAEDAVFIRTMAQAVGRDRAHLVLALDGWWDVEGNREAHHVFCARGNKVWTEAEWLKFGRANFQPVEPSPKPRPKRVERPSGRKLAI